MSFLFGSTQNVPPPEQDLFGVDKERVATNESARVLPWFAGTRWMAVTWLGDAFNVQTEAITQKVGKKKQTTGYKYYASLAALVCCGTVDRIAKIKFNDEIVWTGPIDRGDEDYVTITIAGRGTIYFYWGNETQTLDPRLSSSGQQHFAYRGQCYFVGYTIFFGADTTNAPNIQVEVGRWPQPNWLTAGQCKISDIDANPMAILWDWWTNTRFGAGRNESDLDTVALTTVAVQLATEGFGLSPLITSDDDLKTNLVKLMEHFDGYPTANMGKLGVDLVRPPTGTIPVITKDDYLRDPVVTGDSWTDTFDEVRVKFKDYTLDGRDNVAKHHERANFVITGRHRSQNLDRPWVVQHSVASMIAASFGRISGLAQSKGSMQIRQSSADCKSIDVGSVFDMRTRDNLTVRYRVDAKTEPNPGKRDVQISFRSDTGWANSDYYRATQVEQAESPITQPEQPYETRILDSPYAFSKSDVPGLLFMSARGNQHDTAFVVWKAQLPEASYEASMDHRNGLPFERWGLRAQLSSEYSEDTSTVDNEIGILFEVLGPDSTLLDGEWDDSDGLEHKLLGFFGATANEIGSIFNVVKTGTTTYTANVIRGLS